MIRIGNPEMWMHRSTTFRKPMQKGKYGRVMNIDVVLSRSTFDVIQSRMLFESITSMFTTLPMRKGRGFSECC